MKIKRHNIIEIAEHWILAISGLMLLFTGIGELPLYKRYYFILKIPGLGWAGDYYKHLTLHYIFAMLFVGIIIFHILYHGIRGDKGLVPKKGDMGRSAKVILAMLGIGREPPSDKYLPEQRIAYIGIGIIILVLTLTGIFKIVKNIPALYVPPIINGINTLAHTLAAFVFMLAFIIHVGVFIFRINRPLLKSMFTGSIDSEYVRERHGLWYKELKEQGIIRDSAQTEKNN